MKIVFNHKLCQNDRVMYSSTNYHEIEQLRQEIQAYFKANPDSRFCHIRTFLTQDHSNPMQVVFDRSSLHIRSKQEYVGMLKRSYVFI